MNPTDTSTNDTRVAFVTGASGGIGGGGESSWPTDPVTPQTGDQDRVFDDVERDPSR